jgi:dolichyl-phosphate-mannose-protein mannosyltransferase
VQTFLFFTLMCPPRGRIRGETHGTYRALVRLVYRLAQNLRLVGPPDKRFSGGQPLKTKPFVDAKTQPIAILLTLSFGVILRLGRLRYGLPDFLEEALPLRVALGMTNVTTGRIDWNPHYFNYPSLSIYLHLLVQQGAYYLGRLVGQYRNYADYMLAFTVDPTPMVVAARMVGVLCDSAAILATFRLGTRFGTGPAVVGAFLVAAAPALIVTSSAVFSDTLMTALCAWSLERMVTWSESGRRRDLVIASLLAGLAAGAKYPAAILVAPLAFLAVRREGVSRGLHTAAVAAGVACAAFLVSTPFALLDPAAFWRDFSFERHHAAGGHFGSLGHASFGFHLRNLIANLGWPGLVLALFSVAAAVRLPRTRTAVSALWVFVVAFGLPISLASIDAERYLLPIVVTASMLATIAWHGASQMLATRSPRWLPATLLALVLIPAMLGGWRALGRGRVQTQVEARRWCDSNLPHDALIVQEGYSARLPTNLQKQDFKQRPAYTLASESIKKRLDAIRAYHVVVIPLEVAGGVSARVPVPGRAPVEVALFNHASDLSAVFYDPALLRGVSYVMTSGAVRSRYEADASRYRAEAGFYSWLDQHGEVVARFDPGARSDGPGIVVYKLPDGVEAYESATLDTLWWVAVLPADHCARVDRALREAGVSPAPDESGGEQSACDAMRTDLFRSRVEPFTMALANELAVLNRNAAARELARAILATDPSNLDACIVAGVTSGRMGKWTDALALIQRTIVARGATNEAPVLDLLHARALGGLGRVDQARRELGAIAARFPADDPIGKQARAEAQRLPQ